MVWILRAEGRGKDGLAVKKKIKAARESGGEIRLKPLSKHKELCITQEVVENVKKGICPAVNGQCLTMMEVMMVML